VPYLATIYVSLREPLAEPPPDSYTSNGEVRRGVPMEIKGEYRIAAPREKVFAALNDRTCCRPAFPAANRSRSSRHRDDGQGALRIGPVSAAFSGKVTLSDIDPPNGYKISAKGRAASPASPRAAPWSSSPTTAARPC
jgi:hypothetical protein